MVDASAVVTSALAARTGAAGADPEVGAIDALARAVKRSWRIISRTCSRRAAVAVCPPASR